MSESKDFKIIRGYYLLGGGQDPIAYYFKIGREHQDFEEIVAGDVCVSFFQNNEVITSIPALIRVDGVLINEKMVEMALQDEKKSHQPLLPIVGIYEHFNPLAFKKLMETYDSLRTEIQDLAQVEYVQGSIFEFLEEETEVFE